MSRHACDPDNLCDECKSEDGVNVGTQLQMLLNLLPEFGIELKASEDTELVYPEGSLVINVRGSNPYYPERGSVEQSTDFVFTASGDFIKTCIWK